MKKIIATDYSAYYPKPRKGDECKKVDCARYEAYKAWNCGTSSLDFCMNCKNSHVSQYKRKED